ncbi:hypothetical protein ACFS3C_13320 [Azotobacter vinelandii]
MYVRSVRAGPCCARPWKNSLAAFEQRPELSYLGIVQPETGEYGNLERTATGEILLWLFPGNRPTDPAVRNFILTDEGFVPPSDLPRQRL